MCRKKHILSCTFIQINKEMGASQILDKDTWDDICWFVHVWKGEKEAFKFLLAMLRFEMIFAREFYLFSIVG